jgi:hypothetical protein
MKPLQTLESWLDGLSISDCSCPFEWRSLGRLYGLSFGHGWVRMRTEPDCPHHGERRRAG